MSRTEGLARARSRRACCLGAVLVVLAVAAKADEPAARIDAAKQDKEGFLVHLVDSPYQAGQTAIRLLLPERLQDGSHYPVVYVLPVMAGNENHFGNGLREVKQHNLHNKYQAVFVAPTFSHLPWYADHPTEPGMRQETYFLKVVVPFVEKTYPVRAQPQGRLLLGFSKSGWGAFSLLLRHLDLFGKAAAWDAPLMKDQPNHYGMGEIFGTQENFEKYQISKLLEQHAADLQAEKRLVLTGYGNFRQHHQQAHDLMAKLGAAHDYRDGPARKHDWHSGWLEEAVGLLFYDGQAAPSPGGSAVKGCESL